MCSQELRNKQEKTINPKIKPEILLFDFMVFETSGLY